MDLIGLAVSFRVEEHGWVKAEARGVPVTATGRDRAEAESFLVDALRAYFHDAALRNADDPLEAQAMLCVIPADPAWRPIQAPTASDVATRD